MLVFFRFFARKEAFSCNVRSLGFCYLPGLRGFGGSARRESCLGLDAWSSTQTELPRDPRVGAHSSRCAGSSPQGGVGCLSPTELHFVALRSAEYETRAKECDDMANGVDACYGLASQLRELPSAVEKAARLLAGLSRALRRSAHWR